MGRVQREYFLVCCFRLKRRWCEERRWSCYSVTPAIRYSHNQKTSRKYSASTSSSSNNPERNTVNTLVYRILHLWTKGLFTPYENVSENEKDEAIPDKHQK